jgi:hypothetical protein
MALEYCRTISLKVSKYQPVQPVRAELGCPIRLDQLIYYGQYTLRQRILQVAYSLDFNTIFDPTPAFACNPLILPDDTTEGVTEFRAFGLRIC